MTLAHTDSIQISQKERTIRLRNSSQVNSRQLPARAIQSERATQVVRSSRPHYAAATWPRDCN
jgi:hypothetical protein